MIPSQPARRARASIVAPRALVSPIRSVGSSGASANSDSRRARRSRQGHGVSVARPSRSTSNTTSVAGASTERRAISRVSLRCMRACSGWNSLAAGAPARDRRRRATISPSSTTRCPMREPNDRSAATTSGNCGCFSLPLRVTRRTRRAEMSATTRMPSYFGSYVQPPPRGIAWPRVAYIGSGSVARVTDTIANERQDGCRSPASGSRRRAAGAAGGDANARAHAPGRSTRSGESGSP